MSPKEITKLFKKAKLRTHEANNEILNFLKEQNNFDLSGKHGEAALHWAAFYGNINLIEQLVQNGASINIQDEGNQRTPMIWAALRILHNIDRYSKVINKLEELGADPSIRDHNQNNVMEILESLNKINDKLNFASKFTLDDSQDEFLLYRPYPVLPIDEEDTTIFALHGDDSSDEENGDCSQYDLEESWSKFKKSVEFQKLSDQGIEKSYIYYLFVIQAIGISYLYSSSVNDSYYHHHSGKASLGKNEIKANNEKIEAWIAEALIETAKSVIYWDEPTQDQTQKIEKDVYGQTDENDGTTTVGIAQELSECLHKLLQKAKLRNAKSIVANIHEIDVAANNKKANKLKKVLKEVKGELKHPGQYKSLVIEHPEVVIKHHSKSISPPHSENSALYYTSCLLRLPERIQAKNELTYENEEEKKFVDYFDKIFYEKLASLRKKHGIEFNRGINEIVVFNMNKPNYNSTLFFKNIRLGNRFEKRKIKQHEEALSVHTNPKAKKGSIKMGYYIHRHSTWILPSDVSVKLKERISTNLARSSYVMFDNKKEEDEKKNDDRGTAYEDLANKIVEISKKNPEAKIASRIRKLIIGDKFNGNGNSQDENSKIFLGELTFLLFFCEPPRNPSAFVTHQMMLDLIIDGSKTWQDFFAKYADTEYLGGEMPMSMKNAVSYSRYLSEIFAPFMPFPYIYEGEVSKDFSGIKEFINRTVKLISEWRKQQPNYKEVRLSKLILDKQEDWYSLTKETNLSPSKATTYNKNKTSRLSEDFSNLFPFSTNKEEVELEDTDRWYAEEKVNFLLKYHLQSNENIELLDAISATQLGGATLATNLWDLLIQHILKKSNNDEIKPVTLIPLNLHANHWSLLIIERDENAVASAIRYIDPLGDFPPETVIKAISSIQEFNNVLIDCHPIQFQTDGFNCGPWIIAIAKYYSDNNLLPRYKWKIDIEELRNSYDEIWHDEIWKGSYEISETKPTTLLKLTP